MRNERDEIILPGFRLDNKLDAAELNYSNLFFATPPKSHVKQERKRGKCLKTIILILMEFQSS